MTKELLQRPELPELIDIGVNLTNKAFARDLDQVLHRAHAAGVTRMVVTGTSVIGSRAAAELATGHHGVLFATAGVHPHHATSCDEHTIAALAELAARREVVAIGECGLDYNRNYSPPATQRRWFEAQTRLAADLGYPLFVHERDAAEDVLAILRRYRHRLPAVVIHCFTGTKDILTKYIDLDLHIGITGWICDERRGRHLHSIINTIPPHRLMVETDAPYLLPRTVTPKPKHGRNEPSLLPHVVAMVAQCMGVPESDVAHTTTTTAAAFFSLPK